MGLLGLDVALNQALKQELTEEEAGRLAQELGTPMFLVDNDRQLYLLVEACPAVWPPPGFCGPRVGRHRDPAPRALAGAGIPRDDRAP